MTVDELYELFRSDVVDTATPYLWSDDEVFVYMDDAYRMFVRQLGGIPDRSTESVCNVAITQGVASSDVSPLILKYRTAYLASDGRKLDIINGIEEPLSYGSDYGNSSNTRSKVPGKVTALIVGEERNARKGVVYWSRIPDADDTVQLAVYRLPLDRITSANTSFDFYEVGDEHHLSFLDWMKHRAYEKQDAETFDKAKSAEHKAAFLAYCRSAKAEWDRYKSKPRVVRYAGL